MISDHIEVSHNGYKTKKLWSRLGAGETKAVNIVLETSFAKHSSRIKTDQISNNAIAYNNSGKENILKGQNKRAMQDLNKAIDLDPNYANAYYNRGEAFRQLKQYTKAIQDFTKAIALDSCLLPT